MSAQLLLETDRLLIRNLQPDDLSDFMVYRSNPEVVRYQGFSVLNMKQGRDFIQIQQHLRYGRPGTWVQYAIVLRETGEVIGDCGLRTPESEDQPAEIGITISHLEQQQGYGREAFSALIDWLFREQEVQQICEITDSRNMASIALLRSTGFRQEGNLHERVWFKGDWCSEYQYVLNRSDWQASRQPAEVAVTVSAPARKKRTLSVKR